MSDIIEIERKFLVDSSWQAQGETLTIRQGFLATNDHLVCRIRQKGEVFYISVKATIKGIRRHDFEYVIPELDGRIMLEEYCELPPIEKVRHFVTYEGMLWEVDVFTGPNEGLIVAEIELKSEDQEFALPPWVTEEVTDDFRYQNSSLYTHPFQDW